MRAVIAATKGRNIPTRKQMTELISQEFIKPVSPTHNHLKSYDYSTLDQFSPSNYISILLYYPPPALGEDNQNPNAINSTRLKQLKKSLSQVLAHYYPLAGRLGKNNTSVDATMKVCHLSRHLCTINARKTFS